MTVEATTRKAGPFPGNSVTTQFPFDFKVFTKADIAVVLTDPDGAATTLVLDSDYSVLLNSDQNAVPGGTVTYPLVGLPMANPSTVAIVGALEYNQLTDITNVGRFNPDVIERSLDKLTILLQQLYEISGRTLQAAIGTTVKLIFPAPSPGKFLRWNGPGTGLENADAGTDSMTLQGFLLDSTGASRGAGMIGFNAGLTYPPSSVGRQLVDINGELGTVSNDLEQLSDGLASPVGAGLVGFQQSGVGAAVRTMLAKAREPVSIDDFSGSSSARIQAAVTAVAAVRGNVFVPPGQHDIAFLDATAGTQFYGPGQIRFTPDANSANYRVLNSYADSLTYDLGKEYLYAFHATLYGYNRPTVALYGDSTVNGFGTTAPFRPQDVLDASFFAQGLATFSISNYGVDGQHAGGWNPAAAIADANCRLLIVSYGINDGSYAPVGDALELFYNNMSARLATIRATRGVDTLSICIKASNSTNDWFNGRHQVWHERLNGVYKRLAREFKCYFFDTYALWADSQGAVPWMDSISYGGQQAHIHPTNLCNMWMWGKLAEELVPKAINQRLYNGFRNVRQDYAELNVSVTPANVPYGISMHRATSAGGWAYDGAVITIKQADGVATQRNIRFGNAQVASAVRHASSSSGWSAFSGVDNPLSLINGWSNYDPTNFSNASFHLGESGEVCLGGVIVPTGAIDGDPILNLPVWARPAKNRIFELPCNTGRCLAVLTSGGNLSPLVFSGTPTYVSLEAVRFKV